MPVVSEYSLQKMANLSEEVRTFVKRLEESEDGRQIKGAVVSKVKLILSEQGPEYDAVLVGSCGNGFETKSSDLDFTIMPKNANMFLSSQPYKILTNFQKSVEKEDCFKDIVFVSAAKVPVVRFAYHVDNQTLNCDISVQRENNIFNAVLLKAYSEIDDRVKPLVISLKEWAKAAKVIDAKHNRLSSFTFTLLVIHYLQYGCSYPKGGQKSPRILPSLQDKHSTFFEDDDGRAMELAKYLSEPLPSNIVAHSTTNTKSLRDLMVGFLAHCCNFNWSMTGISVRKGTYKYRPRKRGSNNTCLYVEDPYQEDNTARGVYKEDIWKEILDQFKKAERCLREGKSFQELLTEVRVNI